LREAGRVARRKPDVRLVRSLQQVEDATQRVRTVEADLEDARDELRRALVDAREHGVSLAVLAKIVGVSRQRMSAMLRA